MPSAIGRVAGTVLSTALVALSSIALTAASVSPAHADATTVSVDTYRTGWDRNEPGLTPAQVSSSDFGQQFSTAVDWQVYAQPVVFGGTVVVVTETNHVYGTDAATGAIKWSTAYGAPWPASGVTTPGATWSCGDLAPYIGITSTPVYDPASGNIYLAAKVNDGTDATVPHYYLYALSEATGAVRPGGAGQPGRCAVAIASR